MKSNSLMGTMRIHLLLFIGLKIDASTATISASVLRRTSLASFNDAYTVNSACECKQRCSVQEACLAASFKSPSTCWVYSGGTGGEQSGGTGEGLELQQDDEFITWLKNGDMVLTTTEVTTESTTTIPPVVPFFVSSLAISTLTLEAMTSACARQDGVPGSIITSQEYAWIKENLDFGNSFIKTAVPAFVGGDSYFWYDGPEVLSTGVFQEGVNFYGNAYAPEPYIVIDFDYSLRTTEQTEKYYCILCKEN